MKIITITLTIILLSSAILPILSQDAFASHPTGYPVASNGVTLQVNQKTFTPGEPIEISVEIPDSLLVHGQVPGQPFFLSLSNPYAVKDQQRTIWLSYNDTGKYTFTFSTADKPFWNKINEYEIFFAYQGLGWQKETIHLVSSHPIPPPPPIGEFTIPPTTNDSGNNKKKNGGGCADCVPPTLGLNTNYKRVVDYGFGYNGNMVQVNKWYTEFPKIIVNVGEPNLLEVKAYENNGITNMKWIQACFGASEKGMPLDECEALITIHLETNGTTEWIGVKKIDIVDKDNLLDNETILADVYLTNCTPSSQSQCVKLDLTHTFREAPLNNMVIINVADKPRNSQNFHFNHGVEVHGISLNGEPTITKFHKDSAQDITDNWITYTRDSKVNDTWTDEYGIQYQRINDNNFVRLTPLEPWTCTDKPLDEIMVPTRSNCNFRALTVIWDK